MMIVKSIALLLTLNFSISVFAATTSDCKASGQTIAINNGQALDWKRTTQNQFHSRAHIQGTLTKVYSDKTGHHHFELNIGANAADTIEVVYNEGFGAVPALKAGMQVEACGDFITSNAPSGHFPASPDGALVHWVHRSPNPHHESGFMVVDGVLCGQN